MNTLSLIYLPYIYLFFFWLANRYSHHIRYYIFYQKFNIKSIFNRKIIIIIKVVII